MLKESGLPANKASDTALIVGEPLRGQLYSRRPAALPEPASGLRAFA